MTQTMLERAFAMAKDGSVRSIDELSRVLAEKGYPAVASHLAAPSLRRQLAVLIRAAHHDDSGATAHEPVRHVRSTWSAEDDAQLRALGTNTAARTKLAREMGRTRGAVDARMAKLGLLGTRRAEQADDTGP
ncbi:MAG: hypothetical protein EOP61_00590 [Sphingomonadales bacterium]|nr:MAG: hypothetical protein EOP61_00590 [Sphingomonadales bacterium]